MGSRNPKFLGEGSELAAKSALVEAAKRCVVNFGWSSATSRKIAQEAALTAALINYHFGSKEDLLFAALEDSGHRVAQTLSEVGFEPELEIADWLCRGVRALMSPEITLDLRVMIEGSTRASKDARLLALAKAQLDAFRAQLVVVLENERAKGRLVLKPGKDAQVELELLAAALAAFADGLALQLVLDPCIEVEKILRTLIPRVLGMGG